MNATRILSVLALGSLGLLFVVPATRAQSPAATLKGPQGFDIPTEMNALYGNYDRANGLSHFARPSDSNRKFDVKAFFVAEVPDSGSMQVLLATSAIPEGENFNCHACSPGIGAALFEKTVDGWTLKASELPAFMFGEQGDPGDAGVVKFGPHQYGIKLEDSGGHMGTGYTMTALFLPWAGGFRSAYSQPTVEDTSDGHGCAAPQNEEEHREERLPPCYQYHRDLEFVSGDNPEYYDLLIKTSGTGFVGPEVVNISGTKRLRLVDGKYGPNPSDRPTVPGTSVTVTP